MRGDSPARALGFRMPAENAGPRYADGLIPPTCAELPPEDETGTPIVEARIETGTGAAWLAKADRPDPDPQAANRYAWRDADTLSPFTLVVRNRGLVPASGRLRLGWVGPPGTILGAEVLDYELQPGAAAHLDFQARAGTASTLLEATPERGAGCLPTALHFMCRPHTAIRRLRAGLRLDEVVAALAAAAAQPLNGVDPALAQLRLGWTGTHLAVHARITDPEPAHSAPPWAGSDVELFTAMPGSNGRNDTPPRRGNAQIFLLPAVGTSAAAAWSFEPRLEAAPDVALASRLIPGGYELWALIPAARARLDPGPLERIVLEAVVRPVVPGSAARRHTNLFGTADGNDNGPWAMADLHDDA